MNKKQLFLSLVVASSLSQKAVAFHDDSFFVRMMEDMDEHMRLVEKQMQSVREEMKTVFTQERFKGVTAQITEKDDAVVVTINNIKSDVHEASFNEDKKQLIVKTDEDTIKCSAHGNSIALTMMKEKKETADDKKNQQSFSAMSSSSLVQSIDHEVDLSQAGIEYNAEGATLTLMLPIKKEKTTSIPVHVKKTSKEEKMPADIKKS